MIIHNFTVETEDKKNPVSVKSFSVFFFFLKIIQHETEGHHRLRVAAPFPQKEIKHLSDSHSTKILTNDWTISSQ